MKSKKIDIAARQAIRYLSRVTGQIFPPDLYADLYQAAALRCVEEGDGNLFISAKRGASAEYQRYYRYRNGDALLRNLRRAGWKEGGIDEIRPAVEKLFLDCRRKRGERGAAAACRDAEILDMLTRGYSDEGISLELGIPWVSIREYRKIIKRNLRKALDTGPNE